MARTVYPQEGASQAELAQMVTSVPVIVVDSDGRILFFNRAFQQVTGYSEQDAIGRSAVDLLAVPDKSGRLAEMLAQVGVGSPAICGETCIAGTNGELRLIAWSVVAGGGEDNGAQSSSQHASTSPQSGVPEKSLAKVTP